MDTNEGGWETVGQRERAQRYLRSSEQASLTRTASTQESNLRPASPKSRSTPQNPFPGRARVAGRRSQAYEGKGRGGRQEPRGESDSRFRQAAPARLGKQAREDARNALLAEARKSEKDVFTGRRHCLSCGKPFSTIESLAEHLKKHDGVNSDDYKILHYERQRARGGVAPRPSRTGFTTSDLFEAAIAKARLKTESGAGSSKASSQRRAQNARKVVASTGLARNVSKASKVKAGSSRNDGLENIEEDERMRLESAFQGLKLKRTRRLAKKTKRVTAVKKFVLLERVAAAQRMVEKAASRVHDFELRKSLSGDEFLDETEALQQEAEIAALRAALSKAEEGLRVAKALMQKKVTARQHIMNLLYVSLRNDTVNEGLSEMDSLEYDQKAAEEVLALFDQIDDSVSEDEGKDEPQNVQEASNQPMNPPNSGVGTDELVGEIAQNDRVESNDPMSPSSSSISDFEGPPDLLSAWASSAGLNQQFAEFLNMEPPPINSFENTSLASQDLNRSLVTTDTVPAGSREGEKLEGLPAEGDDVSGCDSDEMSSLGEMHSNVLADWANAAGSGGIDFQSLLFHQEQNSPPSSSQGATDSGNESMSVIETQERNVALRIVNQAETSVDFLKGNAVEVDAGGGVVDKLDWEKNGQDGTSSVAAGNTKGGEESGDKTMVLHQATLNRPKTVRSYAAVLSGKSKIEVPPGKKMGMDSADAGAGQNLGESVENKKKKRRKKKKKPVADGNQPSPLEGEERDQATSFPCDLCGIACSTSSDLREHLKGKSHASKAARHAMLSMKQEGTRENELMESASPGTVKMVDEAVVALLTRLNELQHNSLVRHNEERSKAHRWLTNGAKEVTRALTKGKLKALILAPNVEHPLDEAISKIVEGVRSHGVFAVYALNRKKLGRIFHFRKKMSVVGVLDLNGVQPLFEQLRASVQSNPQIRVGAVDL